MAQNHILLETIALSQAAASVTFDNIPITGYTDLKIVASSRSSNANVIAGISFQVGNGTIDTGANYHYYELTGDGSTASVSNGNVSGLNSVTSGSTSTSNTFGNIEIYISNYTSSTQKAMSADATSENNGASAQQRIQAWRWTGTTAINIARLNATSGNFVEGSTFSIYGVAALNTTPVTAPFATGGNIVANDGTYWYHAFLSSGTFTPLKALSCDYLVVAGGGSGGAAYEGGGGGAGGLRSTVTATGGGGSLETPISVTAQSYAITVGAGGSAVNPESSGNAGSNSTFASITSIGGGYGANGGNNIPGGNGGSGGGTSRSYAGGTGTSGQGFAGGSGGSDVAGGGGGAGAVGATGGAGGAGVAISAFASPTLTGVSNFYAGGGGGGNSGAGGSGGGGAGHPTAAVSATRNTGSGGGGARTYSPGSSGAGGSGLVIIRYAMV
jgi:hypothetical protein